MKNTKIEKKDVKACEANAAQKNINRDAIIHAEKMVNRILLNDPWIPQSEIYDCLKLPTKREIYDCLELPPTTVGDMLDFDIANGPLEFQVTPCFLLDYRLKPMYSNRF